MMLTQVVWWTGLLGQTVLFARGLQSGLVRKFPVFYTYLFYVTLQSLARFSTYSWVPDQYTNVYWVTEFVAVLVGSAVVFEVYRVGLRAYPGTARLARNTLLFVFFMALAKAIVNQWNGRIWGIASTTLELERDLRVVQALVLVPLVLLVGLYAIPLAKNLRGILIGYGLFVGTSVVELTILARTSEAFQIEWAALQPFSWLLVLFVWFLFLWSPVHEPQSVLVDNNYQEIALATETRIRSALDDLRKSVR